MYAPGFQTEILELDSYWIYMLSGFLNVRNLHKLDLYASRFRKKNLELDRN